MDGNYLDERLSAYGKSDFYPFHMPGHKRMGLEFDNPYKIDITEIEGFDNLHHAENLLLDAQNRLRDLYGSRKAYYLVNGSTCGLLSAIGAVVKPGEHVIMARNCHKAVYNAAKIFDLKVNYVFPEQLRCGIQGAVTPEAVENALKKVNSTKVVIVTSPTYDGITSNISKIAEITKKYNSYLIIDEAHGAHFLNLQDVMVSSIHQGADLVIQSLHKTLPCFTQTAVLHVASGRVDTGRVEEMLGIFQTSSPSYVLMAGMDRCVRLLEQSGEELFRRYYRRLDRFYEKVAGLRKLRVLTVDDYERSKVYGVDKSKILVSTRGSGINGKQLYDLLLERFHLQLEMYSAEYVLAMTSIMDSKEGVGRLSDALYWIDNRLEDGLYEKDDRLDDFIRKAYEPRKKMMEVGKASWSESELVPIGECSGRICGEYLYLYPPGIPMVVPGEAVTEDFIEILEKGRNMGLRVEGTGISNGRIRVVR